MTTLGEDPLKPFREIQEKIGEVTRAKVGERIYTWSEHYNNWIDMIQPILRNTSKDEQQNSMVIVRLLDLNYDLLWIMMNVIYSAAYHQVIRELRFLIDSMAQALYLDTEHPGADIYCKMEIVKEIEKDLFGSRLIERLPIQHKEKLKQLYSLLSKYSHSSYKELEPAIIQGKVDYRITSTFDEELFGQCETLTHNVMDVIYLLVLNRFPQLCQRIAEDKVTMQILARFGCQLTLQHLQSLPE